MSGGITPTVNRASAAEMPAIRWLGEDVSERRPAT